MTRILPRSHIPNFVIPHDSNDSVITVKFMFAHAPTATELETITKMCARHGLMIKTINSDFADVVGSPSVFATLFNTKFTTLKNTLDERIYRHTTTDVVLPEELGFVSDVFGFDDVPCVHPYFVLPDPNSRAPLTSFSPLQLASIYKFPAGYNGTGQTIAIIELGGGYLQSDLTNYFNSLGLAKHPTVVAVSVDGATNYPTDPSGASMEVVLDIEIAGAVANASTIVVYFAPNSFMGFYNAIYRAINDTTYRPSIISISWGAPEIYWPTSTLNSYNALFATAVAKGINVYCAAGDNGSSDGVPGGGLYVDFPGSSPNIISCGGTTLVSDGVTVTAETVWNNNSTTSATGGGFSGLFAKPTFQNGIGTIATKRGVPDIAGVADPYTGYRILMNNMVYVVGGTSAVSPLWSGLTARLNQLGGGQSIGFINTNLYSNKPCNDITSGNNGAYTAATGWDPCTGLGSPNGIQLAALPVNTPNFTLSIAPTTRTVIAGVSGVYTVTVASLYGFNGVVTLTTPALSGGMQAVFQANTIVGSGSTTVTLSTVTAGTFAINIVGTSGVLVKSSQIMIAVVNPTFTIVPTPRQRTIFRGASAQYAIGINPLNGFNNNVNLGITGLPFGATAVFSQSNVSPPYSTNLVVTTRTNTPRGVFTLTIRGTSGAQIKTATITLSVR